MKNGLHIDVNGIKRWYLNDQLHRENGPAEEWTNGTKCWYLLGKAHREDGPAMWTDGTKHWYLDGQRHREDGPAIEYSNGEVSWWLNNTKLGNGPAGFWRHWGLLAHSQRCNLNLHKWLAKYT